MNTEGLWNTVSFICWHNYFTIFSLFITVWSTIVIKRDYEFLFFLILHFPADRLLGDLKLIRGSNEWICKTCTFTRSLATEGQHKSEKENSFRSLNCSSQQPLDEVRYHLFQIEKAKVPTRVSLNQFVHMPLAIRKVSDVLLLMVVKAQVQQELLMICYITSTWCKEKVSVEMSFLDYNGGHNLDRLYIFCHYSWSPVPPLNPQRLSLSGMNWTSTDWLANSCQSVSLRINILGLIGWILGFRSCPDRE